MKNFIFITICCLCWGAAAAQKNPLQVSGSSAPLVQFFPNPASTAINFDFKVPVERGSVLEFYSFLGRKMNALQVSGSRVTVNLTDYITGIYIFQLRNPQGRVLETNKFQVAK